MALVLPTLLCLGLSAAQGAQAQWGETFKTPEVPSAGPGNLPQPQITAWPGSMIPVRHPVTIRCHTAADVEMFRISQEGWPEPSDGLKAQESGEVSLTEITSDRSGPYRCSYKSRGRWSRLSEPLKLVMTGAFDKPTLSCAPGTVVPSGDDMELRCFSKTTFEIFILTKEGIPTTQNRSSSPKGSESQAIFLLNRSSSAYRGTYRCYGAFHNHPYVWSHPSDPFQLVVKEAPDRPNPTRPGWSTALPSNHTSQERHQNLLPSQGPPCFSWSSSSSSSSSASVKPRTANAARRDSQRRPPRWAGRPLKLQARRTSPTPS
ncbi:leukocyte immunoglobulin-like receptor subfamily A member 5 isoform X1 [Manis javanica]|uniref:leukocyte immunoglobulin-like receptor subfamily A member 5 isoform X1 n=1 Tax=Manis javanica TaxID=9974 RepID=UPI003C6CDD81